jgi:hypothetical protein
MPNVDDWWDETEAKKQIRRDAATKFLIATREGSYPRGTITTIANKDAARTEFERLGQIVLPPDVHVICLEPDRRELAKIVVFSLLNPANPVPAEPYRRHWLAAWQPYK